MARKNVLKPYNIAPAQSLATGFTTKPTTITYMDNVAYQIDVSTTNSTGTFAVEVSSDYQADETTGTVTNPGNWAALTLGGGTPTVAAANDTIVISLNQLPFNGIRLTYTPTIAGTGTCSIFIQMRQIGG